MVLAWWQEWLISNGYELVALWFRISFVGQILSAFKWFLSGVFSSLWVMFGVILVACLAWAGLAAVPITGLLLFHWFQSGKLILSIGCTSHMDS